MRAVDRCGLLLQTYRGLCALFVCLAVSHSIPFTILSCAKPVEPIELPFAEWTYGVIVEPGS